MIRTRIDSIRMLRNSRNSFLGLYITPNLVMNGMFLTDYSYLTLIPAKWLRNSVMNFVIRFVSKLGVIAETKKNVEHRRQKQLDPPSKPWS